MGVVSRTVDLGGNQAEFRIVSGTVISSDQRSDTHVYGGGGMVSSNGSAVIGAVRSEVAIVRDIWLRDPDGGEHHVRYNSDVPVRAGQFVRYIELHYGRLKGNVSSIPFRLINLTTNMRYDIAGDDYIGESTLLKLLKFLGSWGLLLGGLGIFAWPFVVIVVARDAIAQQSAVKKLAEACTEVTNSLPAPAAAPAAS